MPKQKDNAPYFYRKVAGYRQSLSGVQPERPEVVQVNDAVPTGVTSIASNETGTNILLTNEGTTPAPVELSFENSYLKGVDPDSGTPESPSYVVDDESATRTISVQRDQSPSSYPSTEKITFTGNTGFIQTRAYTIDAPAFSVMVGSLATPTMAFAFNQNLVAGGGSANLNLGSTSSTINPYEVIGSASVVSSSEQPEFEGYAELPNFVYDTVQTTGLHDLSEFWATSGNKRTWIMAWSNIGTLRTGIYSTLFEIQQSKSFGKIYASSSGIGHNVSSNTVLDDTHQHSINGASASEVMVHTIAPKCLVAITWDGVDEFTVRWKQTGHGTGFSYLTRSKTADTGSSNSRHVVVGGGGSKSTNNIRVRNFSAINHELTDSEFTSLCVAAGLPA